MRAKLRQSCVAGAAWMLGASALFAIDLTPTQSVRETDGVKFAELRFHDGGTEVTYEPPAGWTYSGGGAAIRFAPPRISQAEGRVQVAPLAGVPASLDDETQKAMKEAAQRLLPKNCENVTLLSEQKNSILINGHETYEVAFAYSFFGQSFKTSYLFANLEKEQLRVEVSAHPADFDAVYRAFHGSLFSLQWLKPSAANLAGAPK